MPKKRVAVQPPDTFVVRYATGKVTYRRRPDVVAVPAASGSRSGGEGAFDVVPASSARGDVRPVYARTGVDEAAVPTGRVFVRCSERAPIDEGSLASLGVQVESRPEYAPGSAWVRGEDIGAGLGALDALAALPQVSSVEPELLRPKAKR